MAEISLTPSGRLNWLAAQGGAENGARDLAAIGKMFGDDWVGGLFELAAGKVDASAAPTLRYWQGYAESYLSSLCHSPADAAVEMPTEAALTDMAEAAPPMQGGEYLDAAMLSSIWSALNSWTAQSIRDIGSRAALLQARAPRWHEIGRVCFHLAENKADRDRPFAFMVTYAADVSDSGRVRRLPLRNALEFYAGSANRAALIRLLEPVEEAATRCAFVREMVDSGEVYQARAWTVEQAYRLLIAAPQLEIAGLALRLPNWWQKRPRPKVQITIGETSEAIGSAGLLDFDVQLAIGDQQISEVELKALLDTGEGLVFLQGQWVEVDGERLREAIDHWKNLQVQARNGEISFIEGMRLLAGTSSDLREEEGRSESREWEKVVAGDGLRRILAELREPTRSKVPARPEGLRATLRPYQRDGVAWLQLVTGMGLGACLADDMGLGKTMQVLAMLLTKKSMRNKKAGPSLLIVPASLLGNWRSEAERFAPSLEITFLHPAESHPESIASIAAAPAEALAKTDLAITTYAMLMRQSWLEEIEWQHVILDEAQAIKNPAAKQTKAVKRLVAKARVVLTGTPVENRVGDLWSLFDFINPGLLGSTNVFKQFIRKLGSSGTKRFGPLRRLVGPYILRRLKTDRSIIADLPDKIEARCDCILSRAQIKLYEASVRMFERTLEQVDAKARRGLILSMILRLKQVCNHPSQVTGHGDYAAKDSGKFQRLTELCEEIAARQERALVFTQFREIIEPICGHLAGVFGARGLVLHGKTAIRKRKTLVDRFQADDGPPFFVLSLKAGGTGLNLTAASHVIHFDRWWNPAVENQATDRAFRIGQHRNVVVHKFVTRGTIEERIDAMITGKQALAQSLLEDDAPAITELSDAEILEFIRLDVTRICK